jgi:hypothetical protein
VEHIGADSDTVMFRYLTNVSIDRLATVHLGVFTIALAQILGVVLGRGFAAGDIFGRDAGSCSCCVWRWNLWLWC